MAAVALMFVASYGRNVPWQDDFRLVDYYKAPPPLKYYIWTPENEHRIPLAKLAILGIWRLAPGDMRPPMYLTALLLAAASLACVAVAARMRGRSSILDIVFPLTLLNLVQYWNFLMCIQLFVGLACFFEVVALVFVHARGYERARWVCAAAPCLALLPVQGANGFVFAPPVLLFVSVVALAHLRKGRYVNGLVLGGAFVAGIALFANYLLGVHSAPEKVSAWRALGVCLQFLSVYALGASGHYWPTFGAVLLVLTMAATLSVVGGALRKGPDRMRCFGYLCLLAGFAQQILSVALVRGAVDEETIALASRYASIVAPLIATVFFSLEAEGLLGPRLRKGLQVALLLMVMAVLPQNTWYGLHKGNERRALLQSFLDDASRGAPAISLANNYYLHIFPWSKQDCYQSLLTMQTHRLGPFR